MAPGPLTYCHGSVRESRLDFRKYLVIFIAQIRGFQQIRAVAASLAERRLSAPAPDFFVVSTGGSSLAQQNLGDFPIAKSRRPGVIGKIENSHPASLPGRKRLAPRRSLISEYARQQARNTIDDHTTGPFASAQDEITDGNFFIGQMLDDAFVYSLIAAADQNDLIARCQPSRDSLIDETGGLGRKAQPCSSS